MSFLTTKELRKIITSSIPVNSQLYSPYKTIKQTEDCYSCRPLLINKIKSLVSTYIPKFHNKYDIFYLSVSYLDTILSKHPPFLNQENTREMLCLSCFNIALKFIGDRNITNHYIIKQNTRNCKSIYKLYETKCLFYLNYDLVHTTVFDFLNMIILHNGNINKKNTKIFPVAKDILYLLIVNDIFVKYSPFYIAIALIKYCKETIGIYTFDYYDRYFKNEAVVELNMIIRNEYNKDVRDNEDDKVSDLKTMSSTLENKEKKEIKENKEVKDLKVKNEENNVLYFQGQFKISKEQADKRIIMAGRNHSVKRPLIKNISLTSVQGININLNLNSNKREEEKINIDLGQMSKMSIERLARLSIRYIKEKK